MQKLEERLLNSLQAEYFKKNGEIKIDNDLLADQLTRPADLAFEQSDAFQTSERNAIVSDRMNSFKKRYYRIDIVVGKITLRRYAGFFLPEEQKMVDLKHLCKIYDRRVSLALIPFYHDRIEHLEELLETRRREAPATNKKDRKFLENVLKNLKRDRDAETDQVSKMAQQIYDTWGEIVAMQGTQKFRATFADLKVHHGNEFQKGRYEGLADCKDILFKLDPIPAQGVQENGKVEANRCRALKSLVSCRLLVDGETVARSKAVQLNWPAYDVDLLDMFQIHVFTLPSKIQLEVLINEQIVDRFDLIVPGGHVKSLTSASRSIKEYEFSKKQLYIEEEARKGRDLTRPRPAKPTPAEVAAINK